MHPLVLRLLACFALITTLSAQTTLYWDSDGATPGTTNVRNTWDYSAGRPWWSTSSAGNVATQAWTSGSTAVFSAGSNATGYQLVDIGQGVNVDAIYIEEGDVELWGAVYSGYFYDLGTFDVASGATAILDATMRESAGSVNFTKTGAGTLTIKAPNQMTGNFTVSGGTTNISSVSNLSSGTLTVNNGATLANSGILELNNRTVNVTGSGSTLSSVNYIEFGDSDDVTLNISSGGAVSSQSSVAFGIGAGVTGSATVTGAGSHLTSGSQIHVGYYGMGNLTVGSGGRVTPGTILELATYGGSTGTFNLNSGGTLAVGGTNGIVKGAGTANFNLGGGTIEVTGSNLTTSVPANLVSGTTSTVDTNGFDATLSGVLSGDGGIAKSGSGTLTLSSANTHSGGTTVNAGTLTLSTASSLGASTGNVTLNGGTLNLGGFNPTVGTAIFNGGTFTNGNLDNAAEFEVQSGSLGLNLGGSGSLTKTGSGTFTLSGTNTFTGGTTLSGGTLAIATDSALGTAPGSAMAGHLTFNGGTLATTSSFSLNANRGITLGASGGTFSTADGTTLSYAGNIAGTGPLTKAGTGALELSGTNTYSGNTNITAGALFLATPDALYHGDTTQWTKVNIANGAEVSLGIAGTGFDQSAINSLSSNATFGSGSRSFSLYLPTNQTLTEDIDLSGIAQTSLALSGSSPFSLDGHTLSIGVDSGQSLTVNQSFAKGPTGAIGHTGPVGNYTSYIDSGTGGPGSTGGSGGTLDLSGGTIAFASDLTIAGGTGGQGGYGGNAAEHPSGGYGARSRGGNGGNGGTGGNGGSLTLTGDTITFTGEVNLTGGAGGVGGTGGEGAGSYSGSGGIGGTGGTGGTIRLEGGTATFNQDVNLHGGGGGAAGSAAPTGGDAGTGGAGGAGGQFIVDGATVSFAPGASLSLAGGSGTGVGPNGADGTLTLSSGTLQLDTLGWLENTETFDGKFAFTGGILRATDAGESTTLDGSSLLGLALASPTANQTRTLDLAGSLDLSGVIAGSGDLVKAGTGNLTLSAANTFTGDTTITAGTLTLAHVDALQSSTLTTATGLTFGGLTSANLGGLSGSQDLALTNGSAAAVALTIGNNNSDTTYSGVMSGAGSLIKSGTGNLILSGNHTHTGGTTITAGTLTLGGGGAHGSVTGDIINHATLVFDRTGDHTYAGVISGPGSVVQDGSILRLSSAQTYTGATTINSGAYLVLPTTVSQGLSASTTVEIAAGGVLDFSNQALTLAGLSGAGNVYSFGGAAGHLTLNPGSGQSFEFSGDLGAGAAQFALTKSGAGTQILSGANTYTGPTQVDAGTLTLAHASALGSTAGGTQVANGATLAFTNDIALGAEAIANAGTVSNTSGANSFAGILSGDGELVVNDGSLTLTGANTHTGDTIINGGTLTLGHSLALQGSNLTTASGLDFGALTTATLGALSGSQDLALTNGSAAAVALTVGANHTDTTYSGTLSGAGSLTKTGTGTLSLDGTNTYTGNTTVNTGSLFLADANALYNSDTAQWGKLSVGDGATVMVDATADGFTTNQITSLLNAATFSPGTSTLAYHFPDDHKLTADLDLSDVGTAPVSLRLAGDTPFSIDGYHLTLAAASGQTLTVDRVIQGGTAGANGSGGPDPYYGGVGGTGRDGGSLSLTGGHANFSESVSLAGGDAGNGGGGTPVYLNGNVASNGSNGGISGSGGTLTLTQGSATFAQTVDLSGGAGGDGGAGTTTTLNGVLQGGIGGHGSNGANGGAIVVNGGSLTLNDTVTLAGGAGGNGKGPRGGGNGGNGGVGGTVTINDGTLSFGSDASLSLAGGNAGAAGSGFQYNGSAGTAGGQGTLSVAGGTLQLPTVGWLENSSTFDGNFAFTGGTLRATDASESVSLDGSSRLGLSLADASVTADRTLDLAGDLSYSGVVAGSGALTKDGAGNLTLTGTNTYSGGTTVSAGSLTGDTTSLRGDITNNAAVVFDQASSGTYAGDLSGSGTLTKSGAGNLTLSGTNTYAGGTTVSAGSLTIDSDARLGASSGALAVSNGATLATGGDFRTNRVVTIDGAGSNLANNGELIVGHGGTGSLSLTNNATASTYNLTLAYQGGTGTVEIGSGSSLTVGNATSLDTASSSLTVNTGGTLTTARLGGSGSFHLAGGTLRSGAALDSSLAATLTNASTIDTNGHATTLSGNLSGSGSLTKSGTGSLILSGTNTYTGGTTVSAGTLTGNTSSLQGNIANHAAVVFDQASSGTFADVMSGTGTLTKTGAGNLTLSGHNTHSGGTIVNAGTLTVAGDANLGASSGALAVNSGATFHGGTYFASNRNITVDGSGSTLTTGGGELIIGYGGTGSLALTNNAAASTYGLNLAYTGGTGTVDISSGASLFVAAGTHLNTASSTLNLNTGGTLTTSALSGSGTFNLAGGTLRSGAAHSSNLAATLTHASTIDTNGHATTLAGILSGSGSLTKSGAGTLTLTGTNTYSGGTTIAAGTLAVTNLTNLGSGDLEISSGAVLTASSPLAFDSDRNVSVSGAGSTLDSTGYLWFGTSGGAVTNHITVTNGGTISTGQTLSLADNGASSQSTLTVSGANSSASSTGNLYVGYAGQGTATVSNGGSISTDATLSIATTAGSNGTFNLNHGGTLQVGGTNGIAIGAGSGTFNANGGTIRIAGADLTTAAPIALGSGTISTLDTNSLNATLSGSLSGSGALTKTGTGTLTLSAANTYSGDTTINAGVLHLANSAGSATGSGDVTIASGAALTGTGSIGGNLQLAAGAILAPGNSAGLISIEGNFTLNSTSIINLELGGLTRGTQYDAVDVAGTLTLGGTLNVTLIDDFVPTGESTYQLFDATSIGGTFAAVNLPTVINGTWDTSSLASTGQVSLSFSAVPEPGSSAMLWGLATITFVLNRRPRRHRS